MRVRSPAGPSKDRGQRCPAHETTSSTFGLSPPQSQAAERAAKQVATAEALSNLHSIQARVASTIETYEASEAAPDLWAIDPNELGLGEAIDPGEAMRIRAEMIMTSLRQVADERTEALADLHSTGEARRKELAESERKEEQRRRSAGGLDEVEPVSCPDEFYSRLDDVQEQYGRMRARGGAFLLASSRLHRKVADVLDAASRCATAEERAAELAAALSEMAEQRDEAGAALEAAQDELAKAKAELRLRARSATRKKELKAEPAPAAAQPDEPPMPPPPAVAEPDGEASAEAAAACGARFGRQMGEWLGGARATQAHADVVARSIAAQVEAVAAAASLEAGALLSEAVGEAEPAWQTAREAAARRRARALLDERGGAKASGPDADLLRERREATARETALFWELRAVEAVGHAEALAEARAGALELEQRLAAMETALEAAKAQGALANERASEVRASEPRPQPCTSRRRGGGREEGVATRSRWGKRLLPRGIHARRDAREHTRALAPGPHPSLAQSEREPFSPHASALFGTWPDDPPTPPALAPSDRALVSRPSLSPTPLFFCRRASACSRP